MRKSSLLQFVILTYALSWSVFVYGIIIAGDVGSLQDLLTIQSRLELEKLIPYIYIGSFGPLIGAFLTIITGPQPWARMKTWLAGFVRLKFHPVVYVLALFALPVLYVIILPAFGIYPRPDQPANLVYATLLIAPLNGFVTAFFIGAGPLGEEPGWRGYALPKLLKGNSDFKASLVLGVIWTLWHLPVMLASPEWRGGSEFHLFLPQYAFLFVIPLAYAMTKLWRWSNGSIFLAIWFHGIVNFTANYPTNREFWTSDKYTDAQVSLITSIGIVLLAVIFGLVSLTSFGRKRDNWGVILEEQPP